MPSRSLLSHSVIEYLRTLEPDERVHFTSVSAERLAPRLLLLAGVAIVEGESDGLIALWSCSRRSGVSRVVMEELLLQSYLFVGFPRMISAAEALAQVWPRDGVSSAGADNIIPDEATSQRNWQSGLETCGRIYGRRFNDLTTYMQSISPTILQWMILEGYGKVLSRPGVHLADRELFNVSILLLEERERQLYAHLRGALHAGVPADSLSQFINLHEPFNADGVGMARDILGRLVKSSA